MEAESRDRSVELGVAETEYSAVGRVEPVPTAICCRHDAHDRALQAEGSRRAVEHRRAEAEDAPIGADQPVTVRRCGRGRRRRHRWGRDRRGETGGGGGLAAGVIAFEGADAGPVPMKSVAVTVNV